MERMSWLIFFLQPGRALGETIDSFLTLLETFSKLLGCFRFLKSANIVIQYHSFVSAREEAPSKFPALFSRALVHVSDFFQPK